MPEPLPSPEHRRYERLADEYGDAAHGRYNARRRAGCGAGRCLLSDRGRTAVLVGWREATIDVDVRLEPEQDGS